MKTKSFTISYLLITTLFLAALSCNQAGNKQLKNQQSQESNPLNKCVVAFYNVENLFDTIDNPNTFDNDFLPTTDLKWNTQRYTKKLNDLAKVLQTIVSTSLPVLIGLAEVENKAVVEDLSQKTGLKKGNYEVVHEQSPDERGIDVALMYRSEWFEYMEHEAVEIQYPFEKDDKTRDILYVKGILAGTDTLHIFFFFLSSRRGGVEASQPKRVFAAELLKSKINTILAENKNAGIIIMGDMNDEPQNKSLAETLGARGDKNSPLFNLMYNKDLQDLGTYNYRGNWNLLDNLIVSQGLLDAKDDFYVESAEGHIFQKEWMLFKHDKYGYTPNRTYGGPNYYGGYSDHLPVYLILKKE